MMSKSEASSIFRAPAFAASFGLARRDITPPAGIYSRNWGAATFDVAGSVHEPLTATVLVIKGHHGEQPLALVALDLGRWRSEEEEGILAQVLRDAGLAENCGIVALSHTHSGPVFSPASVSQPGGEKIPAYLRTVCDQIRDALREALAGAVPGIWETAVGMCPLAQNRDLRDPSADRFLVGWNPESSADQTLVFGRISDTEGRCLGTVVNYACHPTILAWENQTISPDFVGAMRRVIEQEAGGFCLFLQGASGELAPRHQYVGDVEVAERAGRCLGHAALTLLNHMPKPGRELVFERTVESGAPLAVWQERRRTEIADALLTKALRLQVPIRADLPSSTTLAFELEQCTDSFQKERLRRKLHIRKAIGDQESYPIALHLWRLGGICVVAMTDEVYSLTQGQVREAAGAIPVYFVTLANGGRGYLVPQEAYEENLYAMWQTPYAKGSWELCRDTVCAELKLLFQEFASAPTPAQPL